MTTVRTALNAAAGRLAAAGVEDAAREASWLLAHAAGVSVGNLRARGDQALTAEVAAAFRTMVERRASREPIQYILGTQEFLGLTFRVTPDVLIPRLDTEVLVRAVAVRLARPAGEVHPARRSAPVRAADIGTGSGAIAVGLATLLPGASVVAVDISSAALEVAKENAAANGVAERIAFRLGDLLEPLGEECFAAILSNPPYIPEAEWQCLMPEVRRWEPKGALTPGADGLSFYRRLAADAPAHLQPGGILAVEVGMGQAPAVADLFREAGFAVTKHRDTAGIERVVLGCAE